MKRNQIKAARNADEKCSVSPVQCTCMRSSLWLQRLLFVIAGLNWLTIPDYYLFPNMKKKIEWKTVLVG